MTLAIYGPGGFGRELASFARQSRDVVFISDSQTEIGRRINDIDVHSLACAKTLPDLEVVIAISDARIRRMIVQKCETENVNFASLVAPTHQRGDNIFMGAGGIYCGFTSLTSDVTIGRHFHCNIYSYVAHDCVIGDFVTLAPRVCINGNTIIDDDAYIGTGAVLKQGTHDRPLRIGKGAVIGMGAVVTRDVEPGAVVVGSPARPLQKPDNA